MVAAHVADNTRIYPIYLLTDKQIPIKQGHFSSSENDWYTVEPRSNTVEPRPNTVEPHYIEYSIETQQNIAMSNTVEPCFIEYSTENLAISNKVESCYIYRIQ